MVIVEEVDEKKEWQEVNERIDTIFKSLNLPEKYIWLETSYGARVLFYGKYISTKVAYIYLFNDNGINLIIEHKKYYEKIKPLLDKSEYSFRVKIGE